MPDIYTTIESIIERSGTPYFSFKDIDENKPTGSIKIRVETIHYFLKRHLEQVKASSRSDEDIEREIAAYERQVRADLMREQELAELAAEQQAVLRTKRLLPMVSHASAAHASHDQRV